MIYVCTQDNGSPTEKHGFYNTTNLQNLVKTICGVECEVRGTSIFHKVTLNTATCRAALTAPAAPQPHINDKLALNTLGPLRWLDMVDFYPRKKCMVGNTLLLLFCI